MENQQPTILVIFAHPYPHLSRINKVLSRSALTLEHVTFVDLYQTYPDFLIDVPQEQDRLRRHQLIVFQHPLYWYSCPPLLKEWIDVVLTQGFAFGAGGDSLKGKDFLQVISTGAPWTNYQRQGSYRFTVAEILRPFEATVALCQMRYHYPFLVQGLRNLTDELLATKAAAYRQLLVNYQTQGPAALKEFDSVVQESIEHDPYL
jgi:putative NADPH-quinone reductase